MAMNCNRHSFHFRYTDTSMIETFLTVPSRIVTVKAWDPMNSRSGLRVEFECGGRWSNRMWASYIKRGSEGKWAGAALPHRSLLDPLAATSIHGEPSPVQGILSRQPRTGDVSSRGTGCACLLVVMETEQCSQPQPRVVIRYLLLPSGDLESTSGCPLSVRTPFVVVYLVSTDQNAG